MYRLAIILMFVFDYTVACRPAALIFCCYIIPTATMADPGWGIWGKCPPPPPPPPPPLQEIAYKIEIL